MFLFLDFDGVMHPDRYGVDRYFCHLGRLEDWMRQRPRVELVVSSSWRAVHPLDEIQSYFSQDLQHRIIGGTPQLLRDTWSEAERKQVFVREMEVGLWLEGSGMSATPWVILDDMAELFSPQHPQLVLCDGRVGLTPDTLRQVDHLLNLD
jgi:hypothetical protein